jgi:hypothetical protein
MSPDCSVMRIALLCVICVHLLIVPRCQLRGFSESTCKDYGIVLISHILVASGAGETASNFRVTKCLFRVDGFPFQDDSHITVGRVAGPATVIECLRLGMTLQRTQCSIHARLKRVFHSPGYRRCAGRRPSHEYSRFATQPTIWESLVVHGRTPQPWTRYVRTW